MAEVRVRLHGAEHRKLSLVGLGGIGKTQLAIQFAFWIKANYTDRSVYWLSVSNTQSFDAACTDLAAKLKISKIEDNDDAKKMMQRYLSSEESGKWLLIADNADDRDALFGPPETTDGISQFLPVSESGLTLLTTRHREVAWALSAKSIQQVNELGTDDATQLFYRLRNAGDAKDVVESLMEKLTFHPLAITQAAAYMTVTNTTASEYLDILTGADQDAIELLSREFRDDATRKTSAAATTWLVSFEQIRKRHPAAVELLCFISQIEPRAIPLSLLSEWSTTEQKKFSIGVLSSYGFVTRQKQDTELYNAHRLVYLGTSWWIRKDRESIAQRALAHIEEVFPPCAHENQSISRAYLPHAIRVAMNPDTKEMVDHSASCLKVGLCFRVDGRPYESVEWLSRSCDGRERLNEGHPLRLQSQRVLAGAYLSVGRVGEAIELLGHVMAVNEKLQDTHPSRLDSQQQLAEAYLEAERVGEAIELLEHVVAIREMLPETDPNRLASQHALAAAYLAAGRVGEAIEILEHVVAMEEMLHETHPDRIASQELLATAYLEAGRVGEAIETLEHVVAIKRKTLHETHPSRLHSQPLLAFVYLAAWRVDEALEIPTHVLAMEWKTLHEIHPSRPGSLHAFVSVYRRAGRVSEVMELLKGAVAMRRETLHDRHGNQLGSESSLARP